MFLDKRKITCGMSQCGTCSAVRCGFFRSTFWKWNSACGTLRCGKEFSRKDFVKQEKRCITIVVLPSCENPALLTYQIH